jgi:hypothetical protein
MLIALAAGACAAVPTAFWMACRTILEIQNRVRDDRAALGCCRDCGYRLLEGQERCPECGHSRMSPWSGGAVQALLLTPRERRRLLVLCGSIIAVGFVSAAVCLIQFFWGGRIA